MAVYRQKPDALPIATGGWKGLFFCCFGKSAGETKEQNNVGNHVDYGSTEDKKKIADEEKGSAYAYEEQETSSDSDDEDLKNFKHAQKKRDSVRSSTDVEKAVAAEETQHYDNQAYQVDSPSQMGSTEVRVDLDAVDGRRGVREEVISKEEPPAPVLSVPPSGYVSYYSTPGGSRGDSPSGGASGGASGASSVLGTRTGSGIDVSGVSIGGTESIFTEGEEHLFDVSDLQQDPNAELISKCGQLEITFTYQPEQCKMTIVVNQAKDIPTKDRGGANSTQVRMLLLPTKKQRHKTKIKNGENPAFEETFTFKVPPDSAGEMGVRFRLYGCERMRRERMIGESVVGFASLGLDGPQTHLLTLEPRANISDSLAGKRSMSSSMSSVLTGPSHGDSKLDVSSLSRSDSASSTQSMQHGGMPELLIGLSYNGTTGRMSVEVIKGSNFRNMAMQRAPDTYVKLTLMSANGQEIFRSKTSIRRGQPNPLYKETFMFQVALFQLPDVTLMVSVYNKRSMKRKDMIGWFSTGLNSSGEEELSHWKDMVDSKGEQVCRWHVLLEA